MKNDIEPSVAESGTKWSNDNSTSYSNVDHAIEGTSMFDTLRRTATPHTADMVDIETPALSSHVNYEAEGQYHLFKEGNSPPVPPVLRETATVPVPLSVNHPRTTAPHIIEMANIEAPSPPLPPLPHTLDETLQRCNVFKAGDTRIMRIDIDGQNRNTSRGLKMKIRRTYPVLLAGKLSNREWNDEFCDPVDRHLRILLVPIQRKSDFSERKYILFCFMCVVLTVLSGGIFLYIIACYQYCQSFSNLNSEVNVAAVEAKVCEVCNKITRKCNARSSRPSSDGAPANNDVVKFSCKFDMSTGDEIYPYKIFWIKLELIPYSAAVSRRSTVFKEENTTESVSIPRQSKSTSYVTTRSAFA